MINMAKKTFSEFELKLLEKLDEIVDRLNLLVELAIPPLNIEGLKLGPVEKNVLELCDMKHTRQEMASKLKKSLDVIDHRLSKLKKKGLIKSVKIGEEIFYLRLKR